MQHETGAELAPIILGTSVSIRDPSYTLLALRHLPVALATWVCPVNRMGPVRSHSITNSDTGGLAARRKVEFVDHQFIALIHDLPP
jgi:hypothetical protein